jgi:hypothetical protein
MPITSNEIKWSALWAVLVLMLYGYGFAARASANGGGVVLITPDQERPGTSAEVLADGVRVGCGEVSEAIDRDGTLMVPVVVAWSGDIERLTARSYTHAQCSGVYTDESPPTAVPGVPLGLEVSLLLRLSQPSAPTIESVGEGSGAQPSP